MSKIIACRVERCLGCRSCEIACALEHSTSKTLRGAVRESPRPQRRVTVEMAGRHSLPLQCRHCEDAPCVAVCPTGAIHREEASGLIRVNEDLCIGCKLCTLVCPLGVLRMSERGRSSLKCDQCIDRQTEGRQPACVEACPTHALQLVEADEVQDEARHLVALNIVAALTEDAGPVASRVATGGTSASEAKREIAGKAVRARAEKIEGAQDRHVVVVGSSAAGAMAAIHAARAGAKVTVITADAVTYRRPAIPALLAGHIGDIAEARIFAPETLQAYGIEVLSPARATGLDAGAKTITVETAGGETREIAYDAAVLATGGMPARPPIKGTDKEGVCTFLSAEGARQILDQVEAGARSAVVVGASFIALEVAEALLARGLNVSFNVRSRILRRIVEPDLSAYLQRHFERRCLKMLTDEAISEIGGKGKVEYVVHKGEKMATDLVILG
ncbi:MAG: FAD-dependent oxidoreductase, partial [Planctomycetota bacterium]|nr:FAD-dependent oxidoreductase [Planctomycetota bacterium]